MNCPLAHVPLSKLEQVNTFNTCGIAIQLANMNSKILGYKISLIFPLTYLWDIADSDRVRRALIRLELVFRWC